MSEVDLSIVIPCYNEEQNIPIILEKFSSLLNEDLKFELILVNNGSTDKTGNTIDNEIRKNNYDFARKVTVEKNIGYGYGILEGLRNANGQILCWTHADLQTDPKDTIKACKNYLEKSSYGKNIFVKGHRRNRRLGEIVFSFGMQLVASVSLGIYLSEINAQPKLFPREFYNLMQSPPHDFSLDLYVLYLAKRKGYKIVTIPVYFRERKYGEAKGGGGSDLKTKWKLVKRTFGYIFELRKKIAKEGI